MKTITLFLFFLSSIAFSQAEIKSSNVKTTNQEYDFLTQQYAEDNNVPMLPGYEFKALTERTMDNYNFNYRLFVESSTKNVKAVLITITKTKKSKEKVRYLCMPINNPDLYNKFFLAAEKKLGMTMYFGLIAVGGDLNSKLIDEKFNTH